MVLFFSIIKKIEFNLTVQIKPKMPNSRTADLVSKHKSTLKKCSGISWSVSMHYHESGYCYCGQSCACCRAEVQKKTGEIQIGACTICLNH